MAEIYSQSELVAQKSLTITHRKIGVFSPFGVNRGVSDTPVISDTQLNSKSRYLRYAVINRFPKLSVLSQIGFRHCLSGNAVNSNSFLRAVYVLHIILSMCFCTNNFVLNRLIYNTPLISQNG